MTLPRYCSLLDYWSSYPPTHITLSAIVAAKSRVRRGAQQEDQDEGLPPSPEDSPEMSRVFTRGPYKDQFSVQPMRVVKIDATKKADG